MNRARRSMAPAATDGGPRVRFEKLETLLRVALDMRGTAEGLSLADLERDYGVSRRTAERMRDAIERVFPQMEQANPGELPKRRHFRVVDSDTYLVALGASALRTLSGSEAMTRR